MHLWNRFIWLPDGTMPPGYILPPAEAAVAAPPDYPVKRESGKLVRKTLLRRGSQDWFRNYPPGLRFHMVVELSDGRSIDFEQSAEQAESTIINEGDPVVVDTTECPWGTSINASLDGEVLKGATVTKQIPFGNYERKGQVIRLSQFECDPDFYFGESGGVYGAYGIWFDDQYGTGFVVHRQVISTSITDPEIRLDDRVIVHYRGFAEPFIELDRY